jgi:hypothetical protein
MCFWFGLEIQKSVFRKIERFLSYLTFYPSKKVVPTFIRVEKKFLQIGRAGYQKKRNFALILALSASAVKLGYVWPLVCWPYPLTRQKITAQMEARGH